jgi:hypothetical protein
MENNAYAALVAELTRTADELVAEAGRLHDAADELMAEAERLRACRPAIDGQHHSPNLLMMPPPAARSVALPRATASQVTIAEPGRARPAGPCPAGKD